LESEDFNEQTTDVLKQELVESIEDLLERKGSSKNSRESSLTAYCRCLTAHHLADVLYGKVLDLLGALSRSIKAETTEKETVLALRAVSLTAITYATDTLYEAVADLLKRTISDSQSMATKTAAIQCLGDCLSFGGAGDEEVMEVMSMLLDIVSSDGGTIDANDDPHVVAAALQTYGFLATQVEDVEAESEEAVGFFLDQLDSTDTGVQIAAGENIALFFEKSYTPREEDEESSDEDHKIEESSDEESGPGDSNLVKRYSAFHNPGEVLEKVKGLEGFSTKSMNRRDKRLLHQSFASIKMTVESPNVGLQTNNASKMTVRIHREGEMKIDKWWKLMRLNVIRRLLGGGFVNHYFEGNKQVLNALPLILRSTGVEGVRSPKGGYTSKAVKGRFRRNVVTAGDDYE